MDKSTLFARPRPLPACCACIDWFVQLHPMPRWGPLATAADVAAAAASSDLLWPLALLLQVEPDRGVPCHWVGDRRHYSDVGLPAVCPSSKELRERREERPVGEPKPLLRVGLLRLSALVHHRAASSLARWWASTTPCRAVSPRHACCCSDRLGPRGNNYVLALVLLHNMSPPCTGC